jgi:hypothetical protein
MLSAALLVLAMVPGDVYDPIFHDGYEPASQCPVGRQEVALIAYGFNDTGHAIDVTEWANIWGRESAFDPPIPWPGIASSYPLFLDFGGSTYIAAHFAVPEDNSQNWLGWFTHPDYNYGTDVTGAISPSCGDFSPAARACFTATTSGQVVVPWRTSPGAFCNLVHGNDYYLNLKLSGSLTRPGCSPTLDSCTLSLLNNFSAE